MLLKTFWFISIIFFVDIIIQVNLVFGSNTSLFLRQRPYKERQKTEMLIVPRRSSLLEAYINRWGLSWKKEVKELNDKLYTLLSKYNIALHIYPPSEEMPSNMSNKLNSFFNSPDLIKRLSRVVDYLIEEAKKIPEHIRNKYKQSKINVIIEDIDERDGKLELLIETLSLRGLFANSYIRVGDEAIDDKSNLLRILMMSLIIEDGRSILTFEELNQIAKILNIDISKLQENDLADIDNLPYRRKRLLYELFLFVADALMNKEELEKPEDLLKLQQIRGILASSNLLRGRDGKIYTFNEFGDGEWVSMDDARRIKSYAINWLGTLKSVFSPSLAEKHVEENDPEVRKRFMYTVTRAINLAFSSKEIKYPHTMFEDAISFVQASLPERWRESLALLDNQAQDIKLSLQQV